jgi:hypothetical protein
MNFVKSGIAASRVSATINSLITQKAAGAMAKTKTSNLRALLQRKARYLPRSASLLDPALSGDRKFDEGDFGSGASLGTNLALNSTILSFPRGPI